MVEVAVQPNGRIVVAANAAAPGSGLPVYWFARYLANGAVDPSFGTGGMTRIDMNGYVGAMALQPDGKILAGGGGGAVVRLLSSGALDAGFGSGGVVRVPGSVTALTTQPDGKVAVGGMVNGGRNNDFALHRLLANGALDQSFGVGGGVFLDSGGHDETSGLAVDAGGRIVAAGTAGIDGRYGVALVRVLPDGRLDPTFGEQGLALANLSGSDIETGLVLQPDGKPVIAATLDRTTATASLGRARVSSTCAIFTHETLAPQRFGALLASK